MCRLLTLIPLVFVLTVQAEAQVGSSVTNHRGGRMSVTISNDGPAPLSSLLVVFRQIDSNGTRALNLTFLDNLYNEGQTTIPANGSQVFSCGGEEGVECEFMGYGAIFPNGTIDGDPAMAKFLRERRRSYLENLKALLSETDQGDPDELEKLKTRLEETIEKQRTYDPSLGTKTAPSATWLGLRDAYQVALKQLSAPGTRNPEQIVSDIRITAKHKIALLTPAMKLKPPPPQ
jgi:hypothetical protein